MKVVLRVLDSPVTENETAFRVTLHNDQEAQDLAWRELTHRHWQRIVDSLYFPVLRETLLDYRFLRQRRWRRKLRRRR